MRDIAQAIKDFPKVAKIGFSCGELAQLGEIHAKEDYFTLVVNALKAGYVLGYRDGVKADVLGYRDGVKAATKKGVNA